MASELREKEQQKISDLMISELIYTFTAGFIALFPVMNPIGSGFIVNGFLEGLDDAEKKAAIKKITRNAFLIAIGALVVGHLILLLFNLAIPVIQVGGGIIICKTALGWLSDASNSSTENKEKTISKINLADIEKRLFYPISFPLVLGPGSISVIFTLMANAVIEGNWLKTGANYLVIVLVILAMCIVLYTFLSQGSRILKKMGASGSLVINKMFAFITFCIGIQIIVKGISQIFHLQIL